MANACEYSKLCQTFPKFSEYLKFLGIVDGFIFGLFGEQLKRMDGIKVEKFVLTFI